MALSNKKNGLIPITMGERGGRKENETNKAAFTEAGEVKGRERRDCGIEKNLPYS